MPVGELADALGLDINTVENLCDELARDCETRGFSFCRSATGASFARKRSLSRISNRHSACERPAVFRNRRLKCLPS